MEAAPGLMHRDEEPLTRTQLGRGEMDRALQEAGQEGKRKGGGNIDQEGRRNGGEDVAGKRTGISTAGAWCLSQHRMTTCDLHCS